MNLNIDRDWLLHMAAAEGNGIISVGGLVTRIRQQEQERSDSVEDRHDIEAIVRVVRAEYARTMEFGMTPSLEDYRIAIEDWLRHGVTPGEPVPGQGPGTTLGDLRRPDGTPIDEEV